MTAHSPIPSSIDLILDELYRARRVRSKDSEDESCRRAVERIGERKQVERPARAA